jgi:PAS domain S-box-containing protein
MICAHCEVGTFLRTVARFNRDPNLHDSELSNGSIQATRPFKTKRTLHMSTFLPPLSEQQRLEVLDGYDILDSAPESGFDDAVLLARQICVTPIALVSFVASDRQWFKAGIGLEVCETPREQSICIHALKQPNTLVIPDLTQDDRTKNNPLVLGPPSVRFYAGALLKTVSGVPLGTICVLDYRPRPAGLDEEQQRALEALARQIMTLLELRIASGAMEAARRDKGKPNQCGDLESDRIGLILRNNEMRLRLAQEAGQIGSFEVDIASNEMAVTEQFCRTYGLPVQPFIQANDVQKLIHPGDEHLVSSAATRSSGTVALQAEYRIRRFDTGQVAWISRRARLMSDAKGRPIRMVGTVQDITEKKQQEEQLRLLNEELGHRLKNMLTLVQAIASQTLKGATDKDSVRSFSRRIDALSSAHDVLLKQDWAVADMQLVVEGVLASHNDEQRITIGGPAISLGPKAALSLSLLLHELATNAVKYGALSARNGTVSVLWTKDEGNLELTWKEDGGPSVSPPTNSGLGSRLIALGLVGTANAVVNYEPEGISAKFLAPLDLIEPK